MFLQWRALLKTANQNHLRHEDEAICVFVFAGTCEAVLGANKINEWPLNITIERVKRGCQCRISQAFFRCDINMITQSL